MIAATAWCGIAYAVLGGQPMMIVSIYFTTGVILPATVSLSDFVCSPSPLRLQNGGTGPVLAFTEILYKIAVSMDVPFLTLNAWIGIWVAIYMFIAAFIDLNRIIMLCTRL